MIKNNLWQRYFRSGRKAQVATVITLIIAIMFLFFAITVNLGRLAEKRTKYSNAADSAVLNFASQVGSYSHYLSETYLDGGDNVCEFSWGYFFQQLFISLIFGGIIYLAIVATTTSDSGWVNTMQTIVGWIVLIVLIIILIIILICTWGMTSWLISFVIALLITTIVNSAYNMYKYGGESVSFLSNQSGVRMAVWKKIDRQFQDAGAKMKIQEKALLAALESAATKDTKEVYDVHDDDEDGLTDDKIPRFYQDYCLRLRELEQEQDDLKGYLEKELIPAMDTFAKEVKSTFTYFYNENKEGTFENLLKNIENCHDAGINVSFWQPDSAFDSCVNACTAQLSQLGIDCDQIFKDVDENGCVDQGCDLLDQCVACHEQCLDPLHIMLYEMGSGLAPYDDGFYEWEQALLQGEDTPQTPSDETVKKLAKNFDAWYPMLYDSEYVEGDEDPDYYHIFERWYKDLGSWIGDLEYIYNRLKACADCDYLEPNCCCILKDKISPAQAKLRLFQEQIQVFLFHIDSFEAKTETIGKNTKKLYTWQDTSGYHHVWVKVGKYNTDENKFGNLKMPYIKGYRKDFMKCAKLKEGSGNVGVEIKVFDEQSPPVGAFGWVFRNTKKIAATGELTTLSDPLSIPPEYWVDVLSVAHYSYKSEPPKIVKTWSK